MQELIQTTVKNVLENINNKIDVNPKVLGAFLSLRSCLINEEGFEHPLEYSLTLREWSEIGIKSEECSDMEFLQIFPHLSDYV